MSSKQNSSASIPMTILFGAVAAAAALVIAGAAVTVSPRPAQATPAYAAQTHLPCGKCHVKATGGGALTAFGKAFVKNGHKVK